MEKKEVSKKLCEYLLSLGFYTVISDGEIKGFLKQAYKGSAVGCRVSCYNDFCVHNHGRKCDVEALTIGWKTSSEFRCGERVGYPVCEDYEEMDNGRDD